MVQIAGVLMAVMAAGAGDGTVRPVVLGVDNAGSWLLTKERIEYWNHEPFYEALAELGAQFTTVHLFPVAGAEAMAARIAAIDNGMRDHGLSYALNLEYPNFVSRFEVTPGVDEFEQPGGLHFWILRPEWIRPLLPPAVDRPALRAILYDECEHMQLSNNKYAVHPGTHFDKPFLVNTHGMSLEEAYNALVARCREIRLESYEDRVALHTEQVWPDLFHIFSRAGWTITPKLLKENFASVVMSIALGAALQYQDEGGELWASPDLWWVGQYPGHSPEALRSALLTGYWLGVDGLYVENLDYPGTDKRHPDADPEGSLLRWQGPDRYELTAHGRVVRDFYKNYVPHHPRTFDWRDYRPRVAIVRLPDGGWGQFSAGDEPFPHEEAASRNRLLGNREMPLDEPASEWLHVWPILTHGVVKDGAISYNNPMIYPERQDFFVPIDSVAVFDHTVTGPVLDSVECFIVCGHALSKDTFDALAARAAEGVPVIIARGLYERHATEPPRDGNWLIVDDFRSPEVAEKLRPFLGPPDVARFRFENGTVEFRRGPMPDSVTVAVTDRE